MGNKVVFLPILLFLIVSGCAVSTDTSRETPPTAARPVAKVAAIASYVFLGTVVKANANSRMVRVNKVYYQHGSFDNQTNSVVELIGKNVPASGQHVFYANPVQFGKHVTATMVRVEGTTKAIKAKDIKRDIRQQELMERVKGAELIVIGKVASTRKWQGKLGTDSEHDPQFMVAKINVREVLRGRLENNTAEVLFPSSDDVHWYRAPKLKVGGDGMFLLSRGAEGPGLKAIKDWTLLHRNDYLSGEDIEIVRTILKGV